MATHGKRTVKAREGVDRAKLYSIDEAVKLVKERANAKFDETIEIAMNLGVDPRHSDQMVRGVVNLPTVSNVNSRSAIVQSLFAEQMLKASLPTNARLMCPHCWSTDARTFSTFSEYPSASCWPTYPRLASRSVATTLPA